MSDVLGRGEQGEHLLPGPSSRRGAILVVEVAGLHDKLTSSVKGGMLPLSRDGIDTATRGHHPASTLLPAMEAAGAAFS